MEDDYQRLKEGWREGERDRELILELMFLAWWHWAEPPFLTNFSDDPEVVTLWRELFAYSEGEESNDAEFLFVAGTMAHIFAYALGDETEWKARGLRMIRRAMSLQPTALPLSTFDGRGKYGEYFAHQLRVQLDAP